MKELLRKLLQLDAETDWDHLCLGRPIEKQIEIRAEIGRAIKRVRKELEVQNAGNPVDPTERCG